MLRNYYRLQFFWQDSSPKSWVSNISVRWCHADGTPIRYKFGKPGFGMVESEDGEHFMYHPLFYINKWAHGYELVVHNRREKKCFFPCRVYPSLEEAFFAARKCWIDMDAELTDEDLKLRDHTEMGAWVKTESVDRYVKRNKCQNVELGSSYQGKTLVRWDNYEVALG